MSRAALLLSLLLAACAPAAPVTFGLSPTPGVAGQVVAARQTADSALATVNAAQAGQGEAAIRAADATAAALSTQAAHNLNVQATADALALERLALDVAAAQSQYTAEAALGFEAATQFAQASQTAIWANASATAAPATSTAQMAAALATETIKREQQRTLFETASGGASFLLKLMLFGFGLLVMWWLGGAINADLERRRNNAAYRETPIGPMLLLSDGRGQLVGRLLAAPEPRIIEEPLAAEPAAAPADEIRHTVAGHAAAPIVADWRRPEDTAEREAVAELLRETVKVAGNESRLIPRYTRLPGWRTNPEGWKRETDLLLRAGHVTKSSGKNGGTFITRGRTAYQLLSGVLDHSLPLAPVDLVGANDSQNIS